MSIIKNILKSLSVEFAARFGKHKRDADHPQLWILMYHRILPSDDVRFKTEEPGMVVTPDTFAMHLRELPKYFEIVSLNQWVENYSQGKPLPKRACAITFDDGWRDNYEFALPLLKEHQAPATLFLVAEKIGTDFQFWPNIILSLLHSNQFSLLAQHPSFAKVLSDLAAPEQMNAEFGALCIARLKTLTDSEIFDALDALQWKNKLSFDLQPGLMNWAQAMELSQSGFVEIGSHTCHHKRLNATLSSEVLTHEIKDARSIIERKLNQPVPLFCFPNGDYHAESLELVKNTYRAAVTTRRGINCADQLEPHELLRIGLHEHISNTPKLLSARLSGIR